MKGVVLEACIETLHEAILAEKLGANRLELCSDLHLDGLSPSRELIVEVVQQVSLPVKVMIRPRSGNFIYSKLEIHEMKKTIDFCKKNKVWGVVFGMMQADNSIDVSLTEELVKYSKPLNVTFHKAIDLANSPSKEVERIKHIPIDAMLTSGGAHTALKGSAELRRMQLAAGSMKIIVAGQVTKENLKEIHRTVQAKEYHGRRIVGDLDMKS